MTTVQSAFRVYVDHSCSCCARPVALTDTEHFTVKGEKEYHLEGAGQYVQRGQPVNITCPVFGHPPPSVKWTKNLEPLGEQVNNQLISAYVQNLSVMRYYERCSLPSLSIFLNFHAYDSIHCSLRRIGIIYATVAQPWVCCSKERINHELSEQLELDGNSIKIKEADYSHSGSYSCEAVNEYTANGKTNKPLIIIDKMLDVKNLGTSPKNEFISLLKNSTSLIAHSSPPDCHKHQLTKWAF
uniref:Ig-like domain-containing protein n=1 Tax=Heterorhabditis bacteriophora TaxID=37862 RepID=A0A1I7X211_HETBA